VTWWHKGLDRVELHEKLVELQEIQETFNKGWSPENSTPPKKKHPPKKQPKLAYFLHQGFSDPMFRLNPLQSTSQIILIGLISYSKYSINCPIGSMHALYRVTFTINIPQMLAYIPYMDPMGIYIQLCLKIGYSQLSCFLIISPGWEHDSPSVDCLHLALTKSPIRVGCCTTPEVLINQPTKKSFIKYVQKSFQPLWKMMEFVSWDYHSQYMEK